jgi:hypothetical protein
LRIGRAELLRSKRGDEIFVRATVRGPAEAKDCYLITGSTWFALRNAIENEDVSDAPAVLEASWADPASTTKFSSGDTLAASFREAADQKGGGQIPESPLSSPFATSSPALRTTAEMAPHGTTCLTSKEPHSKIGFDAPTPTYTRATVRP